MVGIRILKEIPLSVLSSLESLDLELKENHDNEDVVNALQSTALKGGKRFRPLLVFLMGELASVESTLIRPYARAIEMVHAASLCHDDVIDGSTLRRGRPTLNVATSNKKAVLAGDYLLAQVIVDLCKEGNLEALEMLSEVIQDLSQGEWIQEDLSLKKFDEILEEEIILVAKKKTASVMSWCMSIPFLFTDKTMKRDLFLQAKYIGMEFGIAFQAIDDLLDFQESSQKEQTLDWQNGVMGRVLYEYRQLGGDLGSADLKEELLAEAKKSVYQKASTQIASCKKALGELTAELGSLNSKQLKAKEALLFLMDYLLERKL